MRTLAHRTQGLLLSKPQYTHKIHMDGDIDIQEVVDPP